MQASELKEIIVDELKDIYSAESQLLKALPKMAKAAESSELRAGFEKHLERNSANARPRQSSVRLLRKKKILTRN